MKYHGHRVTRRSMLRQLTAAAGAVAFFPHVISAQDAAPRFRIGACDWSLGKQSDVAAFAVAKELGLDGVQVSLGTEANDMHLRRPEIQQQFLDAASQEGVAIASLAIGELNRIPYKSDPRAEVWVSDSIDVCTALGVNVVLLAFFSEGDLRDDPQGVDTVVERLKRVAPKAEDVGVYLAIESWLSGPQHLEIIERVGSPNVKVYYDVGNSHLRGYDIYQEIRDLGTEHICEFHAKDYEHIFGQGKVDFVEVRKAMDDIGYSGWIQIEGAQPLGLMESYTADEKYLRQVFS
ncbi:MAG: sugar phosphate isomerase/epimerase [Candidatus Hydrogenedentes bacterium]|nr:sugar phosphate isomerase/epimerase [Candidatus Hydrogenedentota bacterium]